MAISSEGLDRVGVLASVGCAIHCLAAPLIVLLTPALGGVWAHPGTHVAISTIVLPVAAVALRRGVSGHGRRWIMLAGLAGMALVLAGTLMPFLPADALVAAAEHADHRHDDHAAHGHALACACCPTLVTDADTGEQGLHIPPASAVTMLGGALLVLAHAANIRCCARCTPP